MRETATDLEWLGGLIASSVDRAGPFLRSSFQMPEHSLTAGQLVRCLDGLPVIALATVTSGGEPRVAPIGALFVKARLYVPTLATAARARQVQRNPAISASYFQGVDIAVIIHGRADPVGVDDQEFHLLDGLYQEQAGASIRTPGAAATRISPRSTR
ncbi:MAG: hypothetical protein GEU81_06000 [Nitriliruptorales bacterium]|nr:hypothetical protein [Nitriliruptorales bacterium]